MRIALLSYEYPPETGFGGIGTYTYYQAHALARLGHEVHVFAGTDHAERRTYRDGNVTVTRLRKVGFVERLLPRAGRWFGWFHNRVQNAVNMHASFARELRRAKFDVVEMPECGAEGAILNQCGGLPTVVRLHSPAELIMPTYDTNAVDRRLTALVERLGINGARAISSCSHWLAKEVRERMGVQRPIAVIPNGIDLSLFDQDEGIDIHTRFGVPRDRTKIFFANRLEERKGIHVVRDMMLPVLTKNPDVVFVLAGADPHGIVERELRPMLAAKGRADAVLHLGRLTLPEVRACLKQTDVFLLPSIWENAPYSLLEAMSAGRAIVASDCGGVPEILRHEIDGLVARTGDAAAFARAIERLLQPATRARFGQSARARVEARFTDEVVARRSLDFYEWAVGAPAATPARSGGQPVAVLGPDNWFQAAWMRGAPATERPVLAASFAEVGLDELAFALAVLGRTYWASRGRADGHEVAVLDELEALHRQRATAAVAAGSEPAATRTLSLPALSHPIFGDDVSAEAVLDELWRLRGSAAATSWLARELARDDFVEQATRRLAFRRLGIEGLRRQIDVALPALRKVYRNVATAARVVQQDQDFIARDAKGGDLAAAVAAFGLHAPLQRPLAFPSSRRRKSVPAAGPAVTVLIPSYRHEAFVARAIESALAQTWTDVRVLVVDDCSPDGTVAAARAVGDARVEVRVHATNLGLGGSIQAALGTVDTPYVALLNSDDAFHPERLERCLAVLEADAQASIVTTGLVVMDGKERRLTADTTSVLDVGPAAHGWVRWYESVTSGVAAPDRVALPALLRHNHLVTSSNVVCRTDWLRRQAPGIAPLKYCLDWALFLQAAVEGSLRHVADALLGYRLHDSNTVWFGDDLRPGYVHEVNAVVATALHALVAERRRRGVSGNALAEELAGLLTGSVVQHGETDGMALFLARLLEGGDEVPADYRSPGLVDMARQALARRAAPAPQGIGVQRHAVDAMERRLRRIEPLVGSLGHEVAVAREGREDGAALRGRLDGVTTELATARADAASAHADLVATRDRLQATTTERDEALARGRELTAAEARARDELAAAEARTRDALAAAEARASEALAAAEARRRDETARLREQLDSASARCQTLGAALATTEARLARALDEQAVLAHRLDREREQYDATVADLRQRADRAEAERAAADRRAAYDAELAERRRRAALAVAERIETGLDFRFGRLWLRKLGLGGPVKTALRLWTGARIGALRLLHGVQKKLPGRPPARVLIACDGPVPAAGSLQLPTLLALLQREGFEARAVCWRTASTDALPWVFADAARRRIVLSVDAAVLRRDRRWWERRRPEVVRELAAFPTTVSAVGLALSFARTARHAAAAFVHAEGLGEAGFGVFAAHRLNGVQYGLRLRAVDLARLGDAAWRDVVRRAAVVLVDHAGLARDLVAAMGGGLPNLLVVPPLWQRLGQPLRTRQDDLVACVGPFASARGLLTLVEACKVLRDRGVAVRCEVLGGVDDGIDNARALDWLRGRLAALGLLDTFACREQVGEEVVAELLGRAALLFDWRSGEPREAAVAASGAVAAMAAAVPVVGFASAASDVVGDGVEGRLVPPDDVLALADALQAVLGDPSTRAELGAAGRRRYDARHRPELAAVELVARVRAVLHAARS